MESWLPGAGPVAPAPGHHLKRRQVSWVRPWLQEVTIEKVSSGVWLWIKINAQPCKQLVGYCDRFGGTP